MGIVVRDGKTESRVGIVHWWPGRDGRRWQGYACYEHISSIPTFLRMKAYRDRSKYITMIYANLPAGHLSTFAICRHNDQPSREKGRFIALLRMGRLLKSMGLKMEKAA